MQVVKTQQLLRQSLQRRQPATIGFVPTMGALHQGHLSLVRQSLAENEATVVSIFVNPTQFNNPDDLAKYPRTLAGDVQLLSSLGADLMVYAPAAEDLYPQGMQLAEQYPIGPLEHALEGAFRPGHFQGVSQVVDLLLQAVKPGRLYLGQKDFQQCMVVAKLLTQKHPELSLVVAPTVREADGLAMSSRNQRLSATQRQQALVLHEQLQQLTLWLQQNDEASADVLQARLAQAQSAVLQAGFDSVDYFVLAHPEDLSPLSTYQTSMPAVLLVAATLGSVRLIDNMVVS